MKKEKKELMRVQSILENDRMNVGDNFIELLVADVGSLLMDYFDFSGLPKIKMEKFGDRYNVEISILASRIKNFNHVPK